MRRSPRNLKIACKHAGLTHFGGVYFFHEFVRVLQIAQFVEPAPIPTTKSALLHFTDDSGLGLSDNLGFRSGGNRVVPAFQRNLPVPDGLAKLSRSTNSAQILDPGARVVMEATTSRK